jgi:hypothetical protein
VSDVDYAEIRAIYTIANINSFILELYSIPVPIKVLVDFSKFNTYADNC